MSTVEEPIEICERFDLDPENDIQFSGDLVEEWKRQPYLFYKYSKAATYAEKVAKQKSEILKTIRSELIEEANKNPKGCGLEKATAPVVEAYYRNNDDYKDAKEAFIDAEFERDILKVAASAVYMKKAQLENHVKLESLNNYSSPKAQDSTIEQAAEKSVEQKIRKRTLRRPTKS